MIRLEKIFNCTYFSQEYKRNSLIYGRNKKTDHTKKIVKAYINLKLPKEIKDNRQDFSKFLNSRRKDKANVNPLLIGAGNLI